MVLVFVVPAKASIAVIPAEAGIHFEFLVFGFWFGVVAKTDSRPCVIRPPSMAAGHFLLLAQKKVTKENGTLGSAPLAERGVRYGRTGSADRASCPAAESARSLAPPACGARGWSVHPPPRL